MLVLGNGLPLVYLADQWFTEACVNVAYDGGNMTACQTRCSWLVTMHSRLQTLFSPCLC